MNQAEERYSRQIKLFGIEKQNIIEKSKVFIIGLGGLGSPAAELLIRAGIKNLTIIDSDNIEVHNLPRQFLFTEKDLKKSKAQTAKNKLKEINSQTKIETYQLRLTKDNIIILKEADLVLDCTDNLETRFLINDFCKKNKIPWIFAAAIKTKGFVMPILPNGPCLNCFMKNTTLEKCLDVGVINTITASIAALQVTLALKILFQESLKSELYQYNIWKPELKIITVKKNKICKICNP